MGALGWRTGCLARMVQHLVQDSATTRTSVRAVSSIATAKDSSNVLLSTATQPLSVPFQENASALSALLQDLQSKVARVREGGGAKAMSRHRERNKLAPRERITALLDPGSPFLELSQLAGFNLYGMSPTLLLDISRISPHISG
jgi:hypothetical protein